MHWARLRDEIGEVGEHVAVLLRETPDPDLPVPGLEWTVGELGAHLVTVARRNVEVGREGALPTFDGFGTHAGLAAYNARELDEETERDPEELAAILASENEAVLDAYGADGDRGVRWYEVETSVDRAAAIWLGELLVHGLDLARTLGRGWPIHRDQAAEVFRGLTPALPTLVNRDAARSAAGTYHLHLRGARDYTIEVSDDGTCRVREEQPERADLHVSASPVAYLLVGYGRESRWAAIAKGQIVAWGRKPWLALKFADLFEPP